MVQTHAHDLEETIDRLVVVSDVHAHGPAIDAFEAFRRTFDGRSRLICNGDVFGGGARPVQAASWVMEHGRELATLGNHDESMLEGGDEEAPPFTEAGAWSRLTPQQRDYFQGLPRRLILSWRQKSIVLMHGHVTAAGESSSWRLSPDEQIANFTESGADLVVLSHTHYPYVRTRDGVTYANTGSLSSIILGVEDGGRFYAQGGGQDRTAGEDLRSSLLSVTESSGDLQVEILRFEYDRAAALRDLERAGATDMEFRRRWIAEGLVVLE